LPGLPPEPATVSCPERRIPGRKDSARAVAGVDNPLFYEAKTLMVFGDARETMVEILAALKQSV